MFSNIPNLLSLSRLPLGVILYLCISFDRWRGGLIVLGIAVFTDWLDGWWARRFHCGTAIGRSLDPLTDKVFVGGAFIFLIPVRHAVPMEPWIVAIVIIRELIVTGLRGMVEATGKSFGADWFGKLKTVLQFAVLFVALGYKSEAANIIEAGYYRTFQFGYQLLIGSMLVATVGSALQYTVKAVKLLR